MLLARTSFVDVCLSPPALPIIPDHNGLWKICLYMKSFIDFSYYVIICYCSPVAAYLWQTHEGARIDSWNLKPCV